MLTYYNDNDPGVCAWLQALMDEGLIPNGEIDNRSINDIAPDDFRGFGRVHLFAGIGGWELALQLADWPADREVWTGSCPCQPFSSAGKQRGADDDRHLWPELLRLIAECRPATVFGEQVASASGRDWLAGIRSDLETLGYEVGASDLCAASIGAPHIRQRLYWVANTDDPRPQGYGRPVRFNDSQRWEDEARYSSSISISGEPFWSNSELIPCLDGKARRIEPGLEPMVDGIPARVALLKGFGNAIVPQVAAQFIGAFLEAEVMEAARC